MSAMPTLSLLVTRLSVIVTRSASIVSSPVPLGRRERRSAGSVEGLGRLLSASRLPWTAMSLAFGIVRPGAPWTIRPSVLALPSLPATVILVLFSMSNPTVFCSARFAVMVTSLDWPT